MRAQHLPPIRRSVLPVLIAAALGGCASLPLGTEFGRPASGEAVAARALAGVQLDALLKNADSNDRKLDRKSVV